MAFHQAEFGPGVGSILEEINCRWPRDSKRNLTECDLVDYPDALSSCTHEQDVGVRCCKQVSLTDATAFVQ